MARSISTTDVLQLILDDDDGDEVFFEGSDVEFDDESDNEEVEVHEVENAEVQVEANGIGNEVEIEDEN